MGRGWLLLVAVLVLLAAILRQGSLLLVAVLLLILYGVAQLWAKYSLRRLEYSRRLSTSRAFHGDEVTLEISVANRKILPLPWVQIDEEMDEQLALPDSIKTEASHMTGRIILRNLMPLGWYHKVTRVYRVRCRKRGHFAVGPATIQSGDYFRFQVQRMQIEDPLYLTVYPRILPLEQLGIRSREPFGDLRLRRHLFEDPVRAASIRDYAPGDPMKRIHWKASARVGKLQTRVFEHTTSTDFAIFLDVRTVKVPLWGEVTQLLETGAIAAASIANYAVDKGYRVGLYVNHPYPHGGQLIRLAPSSHPDQLQRILEALAMVGPAETISIERFVRQESVNLPWVSTLVAVTAVPTLGLVAALSAFHRIGRPVALVIIGAEDPEFSRDGVPCYHVPAETLWEELDIVAVNQAV